MGQACCALMIVTPVPVVRGVDEDHDIAGLLRCRCAPRRTRPKNGSVMSGTSSATRVTRRAGAPGRRRWAGSRAPRAHSGTRSGGLLRRCAARLAGQHERDRGLGDARTRATSMLVGRSRAGNILLTFSIIRSTLIRMMVFGTRIAAVLTAGAVAAGAVFGAERRPAGRGRRTALVIDASLAGHGRSSWTAARGHGRRLRSAATPTRRARRSLLRRARLSRLRGRRARRRRFAEQTGVDATEVDGLDGALAAAR